jgi:AraC family transcriptional regulator of adaptative response/methylated-DNA-[protein]-cysteine methyltransferase
MIAVASSKGICILEFTDRRMLETQFKQVEKFYGSPILPGKSVYFDELRKQLKEYFNGDRRDFSVALNLVGTEFQKSVWKILQTIPYGETISYKTEAQRLGKPSAVRAVANANGHNRISIIIPCHRVIGDNGKLVGYGGGLWRKEWLLKHEGAIGN